MESRHRQNLDRVSAESAAVISAARQSTQEGAKHIESSRKAIARSLETLSRRFFGVRDD